MSVIFDRWFYPILKENTSILLERVCYLLLVVPLIFICSLLLSLVIEVIAYLVNKLFTAEDFTVDTSEPDILASEAVFVIVPAHNLDILMAIGIGEDDGLGSIEV